MEKTENGAPNWL